MHLESLETVSLVRRIIWHFPSPIRMNYNFYLTLQMKYLQSICYHIIFLLQLKGSPCVQKYERFKMRNMETNLENEIFMCTSPTPPPLASSAALRCHAYV